MQRRFTTPGEIQYFDHKIFVQLERLSMGPGEREARMLLQKLLEHMAEVDRCKECVGPAEHSDCHSTKWRELKKKVKTFLQNAPN